MDKSGPTSTFDLVDIVISFPPTAQEFATTLEAEFKKIGRKVRMSNASGEIAGTLVYILSDPSEDRPTELQFALDQHKRVIPVSSDAAHVVVPTQISGIKPVDFAAGSDFSAAFKILLDRIDEDLKLDLFISYSRKDEPFVQTLEAALRNVELRPWVDRKSIQHSEDWLKAIYSGIEAADNFLFVISPDSVASENCAKELAHAIKHNKRLVPVFRRDTPNRDVPPSLAELDWLPFREADDFSTQFQKLLKTLETDFEYVRAHTRLLTRALEWDKKERDSSLVLRGKDLREAEQWLVQSGSKKPQATNIQSQYITSSRQSANRTQRLILTAISAGLVITIGLFIWAVIQYRIAEKERREAKQRLAALYEEEGRRELLDGSPVRALAYLNEANLEGSTAASLKFLLAQAQQALVGQTTAYNGHNQEVRVVAVSRDNRRAVTAGDGGIARVWDTTNGQLLFSLTGHDGGIRTLTFSPDNQRIVTGSMDQTAKIWDGDSGALLKTLEGHQGFIDSVQFSHNGKYVVTAGADPQAYVWDTETGRRLYALTGHTGPLFKAIFSPDDKLIVTASADKTARIWESKDGHFVAALTDHSNWVSTIAFTPDSARVATASYDNTAKIWDAHTGKRLALLRKGTGEYEHNGHDGPIVVISFSRDGKRVLTASWDRTARVWNGETGEFIATLTGHSDKLTTAAFNDNGTRVVTASEDSTVKVWNAADGSLLASLDGHTEKVNAAVFMPDDRYVVTASLDSRAIVWNWPETARTQPLSLTGHANSVVSATYSSDGKRVVTASVDGTVRVWDTSNGTLLLTLDDGKRALLRSASFSSNGARILTFGDKTELKVWDAASGSQLFALEGGATSVNGASFDPQNKLIVTADADSTSRVFDAATGKLQFTLRGHTATVNAAVFSPDGQHIVTASKDGTAKVWESSTGRLLATMNGHTGEVFTVAYSPDGNRVLTASADKTARIWNSTSGAQLLSLNGHAGMVMMAAFGPFGRQVVTAGQDNSAKIWNALTGELVASLDAHLDVVKSARFDADGTRVATAGDDNTVKIWDAATGRLLASLEGHSDQVSSAIFSPDNTQIVTASDDRTAKLWDVHLETRSKEAINDIVRHYVPFRLESGRLLPAIPQ